MRYINQKIEDRFQLTLLDLLYEALCSVVEDYADDCKELCGSNEDVAEIDYDILDHNANRLLDQINNLIADFSKYECDTDAE